ncbi:type II toxin-antitoxin system RelE/ParE family toxin [Mucilaginibacter arboris]|uniref:Type II toxin-antitoxin system RelE/ParE family toxin n=1 Tax=Mucilaginibacter arboris TaxID=2682090 RepID=A0A7K1SS76_9SPHI|nr:type II toxin-antitoxin system RelE/ParE family toxin [Mucilaginibacter arboris]MVN20094.1 type II toxin-antitoxin system RelE/ParE family toxin [Mucilaginibacter arboris]
MAKQIKWSVRANQDRLEILDYWIKRNQSNSYSIKLDSLFRENIELLAQIPALGKPTDFPNVRIKIVRDYSIFYRITDQFLEIITIWDSRRNPEKLKL